MGRYGQAQVLAAVFLVDLPRLRFSVRADAKYSMLVLQNANGDMLKNEIQPQASRDFAMKSPALAPGRYQLRYRILSPDGDLLEGKVDFVIDDE